jgi:hypothetical protein
MEQRRAVWQLELAYRIYETELKRFLRRYQAVPRGPFLRRNLRMSLDNGLSAGIVEIEGSRNGPMPSGIGACGKTISGSMNHKACMCAGITMLRG